MIEPFTTPTLDSWDKHRRNCIICYDYMYWVSPGCQNGKKIYAQWCERLYFESIEKEEAYFSERINIDYGPF